MEKVIGLLVAGLILAVAMGALTGWLLMLVLGAILQTYGLAGPGFFLSWGLASVLGIISNSGVTAKAN